MAVAYEQDFFIGQVAEVYSEQCGLVQFLQRGYQNLFRWPRVDDIADIEARFIFYADFESSSVNRGRSYTLAAIDKIIQLYEEYKTIYFSD